VSSFYLIFFHLEMKTFFISCAMGTNVLNPCFDYIQHNNTSLGFVIFFVISHVSISFDN
jgi:hypothetical protein